MYCMFSIFLVLFILFVLLFNTKILVHLNLKFHVSWLSNYIYLEFSSVDDYWMDKVFMMLLWDHKVILYWTCVFEKLVSLVYDSMGIVKVVQLLNYMGGFHIFLRFLFVSSVVVYKVTLNPVPLNSSTSIYFPTSNIS